MTTGLARVFPLTLIGAMILAMTTPGEARMRHHHRPSHHRAFHHRPFHHRHGLHHDHARGVGHERTTPLLASSPDIRINSVGEVITNVTH